MELSFQTRMALAFLQARWNALIPAKAVRVELIAHGVRWLHPTKGWRYVSSRRLGHEATPKEQPNV